MFRVTGSEIKIHMGGSIYIYAKKSKTALHSVPSTKENSKQMNDEQTLIDCIPSVIDEMRKIGPRANWISFNQMLARREFPLNNIAFLLFMDVCKFLSKENSSNVQKTK